MALGIVRNGGGEDFLPSWRFNSVSGDCVIVSSKKNESSGEYEKTETDVKFPAKFIMDFANLEVGWMVFSSTGPNFKMVKLGKRMPEKPSNDHKQGFRIRMYSKAHGLSVFANSSKTIGEAMDYLHDAYLKDEKAHAGKVAVVEITGTEKVSIKTKEGAKNYKKPSWSIVSWVDRPEAMTEKAVQEAVATVATDDEF